MAVFVEEVAEVVGGEMVESFVCEEEVFVVDAILYRKPVKLDENRGDVVR